MKAKLFSTLLIFLSLAVSAFAQQCAGSPAHTAEVQVTSLTPPRISCTPSFNGGVGPLTYAWDFGDNTSTTNGWPTHTYSSTGTYVVRLSVTDSSGCTMVYPQTVDFAAPTCHAHFTANNAGFNRVHFDISSSTGFYANNFWDFGDGTTYGNNVQSPEHVYAATGLYTVCQTISYAPNGCNSTFCDTVRVNRFSCGTNVTVIPTLYPNNEVHFGIGGSFTIPTDSSVTTTVVTNLFDYGDGSVADTLHQHTYAQAGTYNVCVTTNGVFSNGATSYTCQDHACTSISINNCSFLPFRDSVVAPQTVLLTNDNLGSGGCGGNPISWDFGDGTRLDTIGFGTQTYHHFPQDGTYNVCVRMANQQGCQGIVCQPVVVQGGACSLTIGMMQTPRENGQTGFMPIMPDSTSFGNYAFHWNYNNLDTRFVTVPAGGTYCVTATDLNTGCTAVACDSSAFCRTLFTPNFLTTNTVGFSNLSANYNLNTWNFGDGTSSTDPNPTHLYTQPGYFTACLNTSNTDTTRCTNGQYCVQINVVSVDTSCLHGDCVFPGDVNKDQIVNNFDLLPIGIGYGIYGTPRALGEQNATFYGHAATNWTQTIATGNINYKHLDCDGDGYISSGDSYGIYLNYGRTHNTVVPTNRPSNAVGIPIYIQFSADSVYTQGGGSYTNLSADIMLGTPAQPATNVYGVAFSINYPAGMVAPSNSYAQYDYSSWFGTGSTVLSLSHDDAANGKMDLAFVRTNRINRSGNGRIATVSWVITDNINGRSMGQVAREFMASISNIRIIDRLNTEKQGNGLSASTIVISNATTATTSENAWQSNVQVFPNPTENLVTVNLGGIRGNAFQVQNSLGQIVITEVINEKPLVQIDFATLVPGVYSLTVQTEKGTVTKKVVKQ